MRRTARKTVVAGAYGAAVWAAALCALAAPASAATLRVPADYATIPAALAAAMPGDSVLVSPGTYPGNINLGVGITLASAAGPESTIISGAPPVAGVNIHAAASPNTRFIGFTVLGFQDGVIAWRGAPEISGNIIHNCVVAGIQAVDSTAAVVRSNLVYANVEGILCDYGTSPLLEQNTSVRNAIGILLLTDCTASLEANIVALSGTSGVRSTGGAPTLGCNDVWANAANYDGNLTDQTGISGNISTDPLFCSTSAGDWDLRQGSPCEADAPGGCGLRGARDVGCMGRTLLVDPAGGGDETTIGAAVARAAAPDTVKVKAGLYNESVTVSSAITLAGMSGAESTRVAAPGGLSALRVTGAAAGAGTWIHGFTLSSPGGTALIADTGSAPRLEDLALVTSACGLHASAASPALAGVTVASSSGDGMQVDGGAAISLSRAVVSRNAGAGIRATAGGAAALACCDVQGNTGGNFVGMADPTGAGGNISQDPLFCAAHEGQYTLRAGSPCLAGGGCGLMGAFDEGCLARLWEINADGSGDAPTIQAGIDSSLAPDTVRVNAGSYAEALQMQPGRVLEGAAGGALPLLAESGAARGIRCANCDSATTIRGLRITGYSSAAVRLDSSSGVRVERCTLTGNGAGVRARGGWLTLDGNLIAGNGTGLVDSAAVQATYNTWDSESGAAITVAGNASLTLENCILSRSGGAGISVAAGGSAALACNDVWANAGGNYVGISPGAGDFSQDPLFCAPGSGNYDISTDSPCAPAHSGLCGLVGEGAVSCGPGTAVPPGGADADAAGDGTRLVVLARPNPLGPGGEIEVNLRAPGGAPADARGALRSLALQLYDVTGRRLWSRLLDGGDGDSAVLGWPPAGLEALPGGVYFLRVTLPGAAPGHAGSMLRVVVIR